MSDYDFIGEIERLRAVVAAQREALRKYGHHVPPCPLWITSGTDEPCSCGFAAALDAESDDTKTQSLHHTPLTSPVDPEGVATQFFCECGQRWIIKDGLRWCKCGRVVGEPLTSPVDRRKQTCIEAWPECWDGGYDPRCCRFPKSCSCWDGTSPVDQHSIVLPGAPASLTASLDTETGEQMTPLPSPVDTAPCPACEANPESRETCPDCDGTGVVR